MRILRLFPVLGLIPAALTLTGCSGTTVGIPLKAVFIPMDQTGPEVQLAGTMDNGFPEYEMSAGRAGTVHLEFAGPYGDATGLDKNCTVDWAKVGTGQVPLANANGVYAMDYELPGGLNLGQSPVTVTCTIVDGTLARSDYVARFFMRATYDYVYWTTSTGIARARVDGTARNDRFITVRGGTTAVTIFADKIYFINNAGVGRADLDGTNVKADFIPLTNEQPEALMVNGRSNLLVWGGPGFEGLARLDGVRITTSPDSSLKLSAYAFRDGVKYSAVRFKGGRPYLVLSLPNGRTQQANLSTSVPRGLTAVDGFPYWTNGNRLSRSTTTSDKNTYEAADETLVSASEPLYGLGFTGRELLVVRIPEKTGTPALMRVAPDGSTSADLLDAIGATGGLTVGPGRDPAPRVTVEDQSGTAITRAEWAEKMMGGIYLKNTGNAPLTVNGATLSDTTVFTVVGNSCTKERTPSGARCVIAITFDPKTSGDFSATLHITGNMNPRGCVDVALHGTWTEPAPALSLYPTDLSFGETLVNATSEAKTVTIDNLGYGALVLPPQAVTLTGTNAGQFVISDNPCNDRGLGFAERCRVSVQYKPTVPGTSTATLEIASNAPDSPHRIALTGTAVAPLPVFSVNPTSHGFGTVATGYPTEYTTFTITNSGAAPMTIAAGAVTLAGGDADQFDFTPDTCDDVTLAPKANCTVKVLFSPSSVGAKQASLRLETNAAGSPHLIPLSGTAVAPALSYSPDLVFLDTTAGFPVETTITVTNDAATTTTIDADPLEITGADSSMFSIVTDGCSGKALIAAQTCDVKVRFAPTGTDTPGSHYVDITVDHDEVGNPLDIAIEGFLQP